MPPLSAFARYTSSFIGVTLLTSFAFQGILHKRVSTTEHDRLTAHRTILESLVQRLKDGEDVGDGEIVRLIRLARGGGEEGGAIEDTPWRDVILGKRINEAKEEKALAEWNAGELGLVASDGGRVLLWKWYSYIRSINQAQGYSCFATAPNDPTGPESNTNPISQATHFPVNSNNKKPPQITGFAASGIFAGPQMVKVKVLARHVKR